MCVQNFLLKYKTCLLIYGVKQNQLFLHNAAFPSSGGFVDMTESCIVCKYQCSCMVQGSEKEGAPRRRSEEVAKEQEVHLSFSLFLQGHAKEMNPCLNFPLKLPPIKLTSPCTPNVPKHRIFTLNSLNSAPFHLLNPAMHHPL